MNNAYSANPNAHYGPPSWDKDEDGEDVFKRAIYPPGGEATITVAEVARLRAVELELLRLRPVARKLAAMLRDTIYDGSQHYLYPGATAERADQALTRAAALGLLAKL